MEIYNDLNKLKTNEKLVIALGTFDGIHLGHQSIIKTAAAVAEKCGGMMAVLSFFNHPLSVIAPELEPQHILSCQEKRYLLAEFGIKILIELSFTRELAEMSAVDFVSLLTSKLSVAALVVGENYTFGRKAEGNAALLSEIGRREGFNVEICPTIQLEGKTVSSTRMRVHIKKGELTDLNQCMGGEYFILSEVVHGDERGRKLGYPTANFSFEKNRAMLPDGVYAVKIHIDGEKYYGIANIGSNPTFEGKECRLEVNIFDFDKNIYGKNVKVSFITNIRGEKKFSSADELIEQINQDKMTAKKIFCLQK